jgi:2-phosphoglycerate kinase
MRRSHPLDSGNHDKRLYAEFWRRDDLWTRIKSRVMPGIVLVGAVSGVAWIVRSLA